MKKKINQFIYWAPRILSVMFILFLTVFSWDVFGENSGFWQTALGLLIHNIPALILALIVWVSWKKYEIVGGIAFILAGIAHMASSIMRATIDPWTTALAISMILDGPAFLIGILFLVGWFKKNN